MQNGANGPEDFGPLTPEQHAEFLEHPLRGDSLYETQEHSKTYAVILRATPEGDPAYRRVKQLLDESNRYESLLRRFMEWGVADVVELTQTY